MQYVRAGSNLDWTMAGVGVIVRVDQTSSMAPAGSSPPDS